MVFTKSFIRKVKAEFPRNIPLHQALDRDDVDYVGRRLSDCCLFSVSPERLTRAIKTGKTQKLLADAETAIRVGRLYGEFCRLQKK